MKTLIFLKKYVFVEQVRISFRDTQKFDIELLVMFSIKRDLILK